MVVADIDAAGAQTAADKLGAENIIASPFTCDVGSKPDVRVIASLCPCCDSRRQAGFVNLMFPCIQPQWIDPG